MQSPELTLTFIYDHAAGNFEVILPNHARFRVERQDISGRLEANLNLFRAACIAQLPEPSRAVGMSKAQIRAEAARLSEGVEVNWIGPRKKEVEFSLEDLGI